MAKRVQQTIVAPKYKCMDCRRSYGWHEKKIGRGTISVSLSLSPRRQVYKVSERPSM